MNRFDTDLMASRFLKAGYEIVPFEGKADIYIINTCTVTAGGDRASRQAIYRAKRTNPDAVVVATGCYAQVSPEELSSLKEVDLIVGNTHKGEILKLVEEFLERRDKKVYVGKIFKEKDLKNFDLVTYFEESRPFIKIQEGCNKFCTFCVIPFARGKVRSVSPDRVVEQVELIVEKGFEEIVLSGTQLSQYGWDLGTDLYELLKRLTSLSALKLIRLSSMHIKELSLKLLDFITAEEKIAPHFHLSLQSGSDRILKLMDRGYTLKEYERVCSYILARRDISAIGTDIIVGFPGEEDKDFENTLRFVEEFPFAYLHIFPYSDRPFTKASGMSPKVPERVKKERVGLLKHIDEKKREAFYRKNVGKFLRATVLCENRLLTENYISVDMPTEADTGKVIEITLGKSQALPEL